MGILTAVFACCCALIALKAPKHALEEQPQVKLPRGLTVDLPLAAKAAPRANDALISVLILPSCDSCSLRSINSKLGSADLSESVVIFDGTQLEVGEELPELNKAAGYPIYRPWPKGIPEILKLYAPARVVVSLSGEIVSLEKL